jgi:hypothetical protein
MFTLLTLIQRGFCAEKYAKLAQSKPMLVLRLRYRKLQSEQNFKYKSLTDEKKPKFINFCTFCNKLSETHSPNYVHFSAPHGFNFFLFKFWTDQYICLRAGD